MLVQDHPWFDEVNVLSIVRLSKAVEHDAVHGRFLFVCDGSPRFRVRRSAFVKLPSDCELRASHVCATTFRVLAGAKFSIVFRATSVFFFVRKVFFFCVY